MLEFCQQFLIILEVYGCNVFKNSLRKGYARGFFIINVTPLKIDDKVAVGLRVDLPDSPPLLLIIGQTGFVMCGFLNIEAAEKVNATAAMVSGVKTFDNVLEADVRAVTSKAQMKGKDAVKLLL
ncbi:MAG: hypothetical protein AOA66_1240 [Candidatus Bathyarchaeota archaeon BA2]|nr:MAG: hypothetical protein AOA66_1240 [Candidatus Bathyarchaeota archaeon BA2]